MAVVAHHLISISTWPHASWSISFSTILLTSLLAIAPFENILSRWSATSLRCLTSAAWPLDFVCRLANGICAARYFLASRVVVAKWCGGENLMLGSTRKASKKASSMACWYTIMAA
jgi:hypothetical protein